MTRKIIHIDMDAFYASVEQRDNPELRGKPIAVGNPEARGVLTTASYEARKFGVGSAMPSVVAKRRCPELIFVPPRFAVYQAVSQQIRVIFAQYTDLIEPLSLDEAYLDVTDNKKHIESAIRVAQLIRAQIKEELNLTASAGVAENKFLAKIASDLHKPDGITVILPTEALSFIAQLPVKSFFGVGKVTAEKMHSLGIYTGLDLRQQSESFLVEHFGKAGHWYYQIARNQDNRPVEPNRVRKSVGVEHTFVNDIRKGAQITSVLTELSQELAARIQNSQSTGRTLTLKVKFSDFKQITRSKTTEHPLSGREEIAVLASTLYQKVELGDQGIRLMGLSLSNLEEKEEVRPALFLE